MKKFCGILVGLLLAAMPASAAYELVWSDEFDGSSLNTNNWNFETGTGNWGWGNGEVQYYTSRTENVRTENGNLVITAKKENYGGSDYTSARITSANKVSARYGKIEARIKLPQGMMGVWPAYWMLGTGASGWPYGGEIDIMEYMCTGDPVTWRQIVNTYHWNNGSMDASNYDHAQYGTNITLSEQPGNRFRVYGVEWTPDYMVGYVADDENGTNRQDICRMDIAGANNRSNGLYAFKYEAYFIFNIALGGSYVNYQIDPSFTEVQMLVDYVRVYQDRAAYPQSSVTAPAEDSDPDPNPDPSIDICTNPFSQYTEVSNSLNSNGWWHDDASWCSYSGTTVTATAPESYTNMYVVAKGNGNPLAANTEYRLSGSIKASQNCNVRVYMEAAGDNMQQLFNDHSIDLQAGVQKNFSVTTTNMQVMYDPCVVIGADNNPANCTFTLDNVQCVATSCGGDVPQPDPEQPDPEQPSEPGSASGSGASISSSSGVQVQYNYSFSYADGKLTVNFDVVNKNDFAGLVSEMTDETSGNVYTENATPGTITQVLDGYLPGQTVTVKMKWMYTGGDAFSQEHSYTIPVASAVEEVVDEQLIVSAYAGRIYCDEPFYVLNLAGQDVTAYNGSLEGIYIVVVGEKAVKVKVNK